MLFVSKSLLQSDEKSRRESRSKQNLTHHYPCRRQRKSFLFDSVTWYQSRSFACFAICFYRKMCLKYRISFSKQKKIGKKNIKRKWNPLLFSIDMAYHIYTFRIFGVLYRWNENRDFDAGICPEDLRRRS